MVPAAVSRKFWTSVAIALLMFLAACGGTGGSRDSNGGSPPPKAVQPAKFAYLCQTSIGFTHGSTGLIQIPTAITGFNVNPATGALTQMAGSPVPSGLCAALATTPDGRFLYLSNVVLTEQGRDASSIVEYAIGTDGALTQIGSIGATAARNLAVSPSGKFLYSTSAGTGPSGLSTIQIAVFQISSSGTLSAAAPAPPPLAGTPSGTAFAPSSKFFYVGVIVDLPSPCTSACKQAAVAAYVTDANTGALTPVAGAPFNAGAPFALSEADIPAGQRIALVIAQNRFLYVPNTIEDDVFGFAIDAGTGALAPLPGSPFGSDLFGTSAAADPSGNFLYVAGAFRGGAQSGPGVAVFSVGSSGRLAQVPGSPFINSQQSPEPNRSLAIDPTGRFLYTVNFDFGFITGFSVSNNGTLTEIPGSPFSTPELNGTNPAGVVLAP